VQPIFVCVAQNLYFCAKIWITLLKYINHSLMVGQIILISVGLMVAALLGRLVIPGVLMVAFDKNLFDLPDERKVHDRPIPRLGGVSFFR
jgi:UDP-N-acetylmuramyl pentapeptide phosphotransferase/UDP-N-acetylglucosamine-1-phosphate transferase